MSANHTLRIATAETLEDIARCYEVMRELRPHLGSESEFVTRVSRQREEGYNLVFLEADNELRGVAGYRLMENLFAGSTLYVDDLVTREADRSLGFGDKLFDWLVAEARAKSCASLELDSNVQRFDAHRFYLRKRMAIEAHHFRLKL